MPDADPFTPEAVAAIAGHMNADHGDDSLRICQALGGVPGATSVTMVGVDADGLDFLAVVNGADVPARVPWGERLTERAQVRTQVVKLHDEACAALGITPPERDQH